MIKPIYLSKLNWFLVLTTIADVLALTELKGIVPVDWMPYILVIQAVIGLVIRNFFTSQPTTRYAADRSRGL